jgi:GNAT superfamily N-acetyltransferase
VPSRFSNERALEISGLVVRAGHRGQGAGRALVEEAARFAEERGVTWIELKTFWPNKTSMEFWQALGFNPRVVQLVASTGGIRRATD